MLRPLLSASSPNANFRAWKKTFARQLGCLSAGLARNATRLIPPRQTAGEHIRCTRLTNELIYRCCQNDTNKGVNSPATLINTENLIGRGSSVCAAPPLHPVLIKAAFALVEQRGQMGEGRYPPRFRLETVT